MRAIVSWLKHQIKTMANRNGYSIVRSDQFANEQAALQRLRDAVTNGKSPAPAIDFLELLSQPVPSPSRPANSLYTSIFSYDGLINDPKVIHNHDFMRNRRYVKAYEVAEQALGYDHKMFWRLHVALWCATQAQKLPGDFVECGVWRGFLATAIMNYIPWPSGDKKFYLFDTWEGLDERYLTEGERNNRAKLEHFKPYYANQYEFVETHFSNYQNVHLVRGSVPETLGSVEVAQVSYLSLDMNCAPPELAAAEHFWDRLVPGGMILLDDYGFVSYEDQKRGFDDFAVNHGVEILALPTGQGLLIKPASADGMKSCPGFRPISSKSSPTQADSGFGGSFLLMSNARAGSTYLQSSLSALGAIGDFEFAIRPYGPPISNQRFLTLGIDDIESEIRKAIGVEQFTYGSKLVLPIYDYLSPEEILQLLQSCRNISRPIHLVRHYWDLLKSNLSRGVAHDFNPVGKGFANSSTMFNELSKLPGSELDRNKSSVFVGLSEGEFKGYLMNLVRNDFAFASIREAGRGITVTYESLSATDSFERLLKFLKVQYSDAEIENVIKNPLLRKLSPIPDSNIPHEGILRDATESCYQYYRHFESEERNAKQIFEAQLGEIKRVFG